MATHTTTKVSITCRRSDGRLHRGVARYQKTVVALEDVKMVETERGRASVYVGADGDRPTRSMDALAHEIDPGVVSTIHRHSWDAMVLVVADTAGPRSTASGSTGARRFLHLPAWSWHRSGNDGDVTVT
jgi:gentisate 1,2-dioxygenase